MCEMGHMSETFWGIELNQKTREVQWFPQSPVQDGSDDDTWTKRLHIKMATLGKGVSKTEEQIVEVETLQSDNSAIRIPLINMTSSSHNTIVTDATFTEMHKVSFRLISGDGPVYLMGCVQENADDDEYSSLSDDSSEASDEDDDMSEKEGTKSKPKAKSPKSKSKQSLKNTPKRSRKDGFEKTKKGKSGKGK